MARDQKDHYYRKAKKEGYRARSAYKLLQINSRFQIIRKGDSVVDLGAAPGGWLQVAKELSQGRVIGVDLAEIDPLEGVVTLRADITKVETLALIKEALGGLANTVISDAAPNLTGAWDVDHSRSIDLARSSLKIAKDLLAPGGNFLVKVFQGDMFMDFLKDVKREFEFVQSTSPQASRKESAEMYVVAKGRLLAPVKRDDVYLVEILGRGKGGDGLARIEEFPIFVKGASPGDRVRIRIRAVKPRFAFGEVIDRLP
jgi:23S rRNA (uridine2552-2'-O)-methyltransferase